MPMLPTHHSAMVVFVLLLACASPVLAVDQAPPQAPAQQSGPPVPLTPRTPAGDPNAAMMRRPRQITEVYEVTGADALNAKLQSLLETGMMITSVTPVTAEGKSLIIIIGMPAPPARPPMAVGQPPQLHPGSPIGGTQPTAQPSPNALAAPSKP